VKVVLERRPERLLLTISDDGVGIPIESLVQTRGIGLESMRHRIEALGGKFRIGNLNGGTKVTATLRLAA
jgi:two-component system, NarL family, sensor kinase